MRSKHKIVPCVLVKASDCPEERLVYSPVSDEAFDTLKQVEEYVKENAVEGRIIPVRQAGPSLELVPVEAVRLKRG